eukprot:TRINITY_DN25398_c0_g1_i1.p1 TRINITY_DN25398_c0_g1~~TRINITY_DN25398_c0_g1_i1.p1  ORF type:complete len:731 (-),score=143.83 TRINITY_DN25398_c0_g1_i1:104-2296(-)
MANHFVAVVIMCFYPLVHGMRDAVISSDGLQTQSPASKELRVFATTFNAGNKPFNNNAGNKEFDVTDDDLTKTLVQGHEDPGEEADIIFLGFQEFRDSSYGWANMVRQQSLWRKFAKTKMDTLKADVERAATPPAEVYEAKAALAKELQEHHLEIESQFLKFKREFGEDAHDFHAHIAKASVVNILSNNVKEATSEMSQELRRRLREYKHNRLEAPVRAFTNMSLAASALREKWDKFDELPVSAKQRDMLAKIHAWTAESLNKIQELKSAYPSMVLSPEGLTLARIHAEKLNTSQQLEMELLDEAKHHRNKFRTALRDFERQVRAEVGKREEEVSTKLREDWGRIGADIALLNRDLEKYTQDGSILKSLAEGASEAVKEPASSMALALSGWKVESNLLVQKLLTRDDIGIEQTDVEVTFEPQRFDSGWRCDKGLHFDTSMYAYINPFSKWNITAEPFESEKCTSRRSTKHANRGCNINNNVGMECGKAVNLLVFRAEKGGTSLRICGLNSHMSYASRASQRMQYIAEAIEQTQEAKCDSVFFMADFNSRLHCESGEKQKLPPFERNTSSGTSMDYILDHFCVDEKCALQNSNWDELNQMLSKDQLKCYEKFKQKEGWKTEDYWDIEPTENIVNHLGLREASSVVFAPTYKVKRDEKIKDGAWKRCLAGQPTCFMNEGKEGKNNPAWTDRVLVKTSSDAVHVETNEYSRRPGPFKSDHVPVTARMTITVKQ